MLPTMVSQGWRKFHSRVLSYQSCTQSVMSRLPGTFSFTLRMMATLSKGMMTAATTSETIRLMVMVRGKRRRTSAASPFRVRSMG